MHFGKADLKSSGLKLYFLGLENKVNISSLKNYDLYPPDTSDSSNEPLLKRSRRCASAVALKKKSNKLYVISLLCINFVYFYVF